MKPAESISVTKIENHSLYIDDDILFIQEVGDSDERIALEAKRIILELLRERGTVNVFIDENLAGKSTPEARKIWKELSEYEKVNKVAFVGLHMVARVIAGFLIKVSGNKKLRFFKDETEALTWLKNDLD